MQICLPKQYTNAFLLIVVVVNRCVIVVQGVLRIRAHLCRFHALHVLVIRAACACMTHLNRDCHERSFLNNLNTASIFKTNTLIPSRRQVFP